MCFRCYGCGWEKTSTLTSKNVVGLLSFVVVVLPSLLCVFFFFSLLVYYRYGVCAFFFRLSFPSKHQYLPNVKSYESIMSLLSCLTFVFSRFLLDGNLSLIFYLLLHVYILCIAFPYIWSIAREKKNRAIAVPPVSSTNLRRKENWLVFLPKRSQC